MTQMTLLVDADIVAYRAASAAETPVDWGNGLWTLHAFEQEVKDSVDAFMEDCIAKAKVDHVHAVISDKLNFRKTVESSYKSNRKNVRRPMLLDFAKDYMVETYNGISYPNLEADDVLGILATQDNTNIIWSIDKDLMTIPAKHLVDGEIIEISEEKADYQFFYQALIGDTTDGYGGCPKVGPKTAEKILDAKSDLTLWERVVTAYIKAGLNEDYALTQARLARILRAGEYDFETNQVKLWSP